MYRKQRIQVRWSDSLSDIFNSMSNGVKQGAVLSPLLFTAYFDKPFERLRASGIGCHVGKMYAGAFEYADDVVLLAPSLDALREMVSISETYATEYQLVFNPSKSKLMSFNISHDNLRCFWYHMKLISVILSVVIYLIWQSLNLYVLLIKGVTI